MGDLSKSIRDQTLSFVVGTVTGSFASASLVWGLPINYLAFTIVLLVIGGSASARIGAHYARGNRPGRKMLILGLTGIVFGLCFVSAGAAIVYRHRTHFKPLFEFQNTSDFLMSPSERPAYGGWLIRISINPETHLKDAKVLLVALTRDEGGKQSSPLNSGYNQAQIGWYASAKSFGPLDLYPGTPNYLVIGYCKEGAPLTFFVNPQDTTYELDALRSLEPGQYRITMLLVATGLEKPVLKSADLRWTGNMRTTEFKLID